MNGKNCSQDVQEALNYLSFDDIPTMKELNTRYRKLALQKHPDKNGGSDTSKEDYQQLQKYYRLIGNCIIDNDTSVCDDEERDHVKAFKNFNFDQKNKFCHMVLIKNKLTTAWNQVLSSRLKFWYLSYIKETHSKVQKIKFSKLDPFQVYFLLLIRQQGL